MQGSQIKNQRHDHHNIHLYPSLQNPQRKLHECVLLANFLDDQALDNVKFKPRLSKLGLDMLHSHNGNLRCA